MKSITIEFNKFKFIKGIVIGLMVGEVVLFVLLCLTSAVMANTGILNNTLLEVMLTVICGISAFISGIVSSKIIKMKGLINGFVSGMLFFIVIFSAGLIMMDGTFTLFTFLKLIVSVLFGTIGGVIGLSKKEKLIK
ncbi:MAG: TIGR04086 family membrane protein [Ruminococcus sp.]